MKRNMIVAVAAAGAIIGGGTLAGIALGAENDTERTDSAALSGNLSARDGGSLGLDGADDDGDDGSAEAGAGVVAGDSAALRAVATALAAAPGVVTEIELDRDDDGPRGWEVEIYDESETWHRIVVSEDGNEVIGERTGWSWDDDDDDDGDRDDDDDDDRAAARSLLAAEASTDAATAIATAESHTGATLREADVDDGHWELELRGEDGTEHELSISLASGDIVAQESERDDDGDRDDDGRDDDADDGADDRDDDGRDDRDDDRDDRDDDGRDDDRDDRDDDGTDD
ncbi:PepSY domain-containing protein [Streptomyces triticirhizae]|uniref:PepSY domain-containing protein n=1 Tax=Streptomyces triticirhizae TaxID=2483353 RepID=A0A3M2L1Y2_9ACTN|nr:PepSY domain-containing protein [Streptomyces triticirhizae]RMI31591.1 hypothetical protein EBN88_25685 [Streptomyces triticirhizae]